MKYVVNVRLLMIAMLVFAFMSVSYGVSESSTMGQLQVSAKSDCLSPGNNAIRLDGNKTYRLSVSGEASYGGYGFTVSQVFFHCANSFSGSASMNSLQGVVKPGESVTISKSTKIYAFLVDNGSNDNSGQVVLNIEEVGTHNTQRLAVNARAHCLSPGNNSLKLSGNRNYTLSVSGEASYGGYGFRVSQVFFHCANNFPGRASMNSLQGVIKPGQSVRISHATRVYAFLVDNGSNDNRGSVTLNIREE